MYQFRGSSQFSRPVQTMLVRMRVCMFCFSMADVVVMSDCSQGIGVIIRMEMAMDVVPLAVRKGMPVLMLMGLQYPDLFELTLTAVGVGSAFPSTVIDVSTVYSKPGSHLKSFMPMAANGSNVTPSYFCPLWTR